MAASEPLDEAAVESLDRRYKPFPASIEWLTQSVNTSLWDETGSLLSTARNEAGEKDLDQARQKVLRAAAITTGAIEGLYTADRGFTITVAEQAVAWQQGVEERGPLTRELFEAQLEAYNFALDAATGHTPISEAWIRNLHEVVTRPQSTYRVHTSAGPQDQPMPKGEYKRYPNHVVLSDGTVHVYAPVGETSPEMARLVEVFGTQEFQSAHPVLQASYSHYALTVIHPFADGNGRVARALGSVWLFRSLSLPLVIFTEQSGEYLRSLASADKGDYASFVDFISERAVDSVMLALEMLRRSKLALPQDSARNLRDLLGYRPGVDHVQIDQFGTTLLQTLAEELNTTTSELDLPSGISFNAVTQLIHDVAPAVDGFRPQATLPRARVVADFQSNPPANAHFQTIVWAYVSIDRSENFPLAFAVNGDILMQFRLSEVQHGLTQAARYRLRNLAEQMVGGALSELEKQARASLDRAGYHFDQ